MQGEFRQVEVEAEGAMAGDLSAEEGVAAPRQGKMYEPGLEVARYWAIESPELWLIALFVASIIVKVGL